MCPVKRREAGVWGLNCQKQQAELKKEIEIEHIFISTFDFFPPPFHTRGAGDPVLECEKDAGHYSVYLSDPWVIVLLPFTAPRAAVKFMRRLCN